MNAYNQCDRKMKIGIVIGRFNPLHTGHCYLIQKAVSESEYVIVAIGGVDESPSPRNLFSTDDIASMIRAEFPIPNLAIIRLSDYVYDDVKWQAKTQKAIEVCIDTLTSKPVNVTLYGYEKDASSSYLKWFPDFAFCNVHSGMILNATDVRNALLDIEPCQQNLPLYKSVLTKYQSYNVANCCYQILERKVNDGSLYKLWNESEHIKAYKKSFSALPYPPIFVTVDALVICNDHVLLIKRKSELGNDKLALAGGFLDHNEPIKNGIVRELKEETCIAIEDDVLYSSLVTIVVFDNPNRSLRGRTITHGGAFIISFDGVLPIVKAADDAKEAFWLPINDLEKYRSEFFEDHYHIIQFLLKECSWYF